MPVIPYLVDVGLMIAGVPEVGIDILAHCAGLIFREEFVDDDEPLGDAFVHALASATRARSSAERQAAQSLGHFGDLEPTHFRGVDVGAVAGDAVGELGEAADRAYRGPGPTAPASSDVTSASSRSISPGKRS